jgi:hypothetical protein
MGKVGVAAVRPFMKDPVAEGCRPALFAAASPDIVKDQIQVSRDLSYFLFRISS